MASAVRYQPLKHFRLFPVRTKADAPPLVEVMQGPPSVSSSALLSSLELNDTNAYGP